MHVFVINSGSSSIKYQLIETEDQECLIKGHVERIGAVASLIKHEIPGSNPIKKSMAIDNHAQALKQIIDFIVSDENSVIGSLDDIEAVGHRVVHGGETFKDSVLIDDDVIHAIQQAFDLAPLHNPPNLEGIKAAQKVLPDIPHVAVFDTAFHHSLPAKAYLYGIPNRFYRRYKIRRYGFHGTSHYYVSRRYYNLVHDGAKKDDLITCHLGNGSSICAIQRGQSIDTSMGFTPLEGLVMGTRSGDIDPSILFYLMEKEELNLSDVHSLLNRHSGLLGLSGYAADMRELIEEANRGDRRCQQAVDVFSYRAQKYIGGYIAALNGADAIIFTAGIGENSPVIRSKILEILEYLGIEIDDELNKQTVGRKEAKISTDDSKVDVYVVPTNEELVIAIDAAKIAIANRQSPWV